MKLLVDSREKWTQRKNGGRLAAYLSANCDYEVKKLDVGDYMFDGGSVTIDRKQNLEELSRNLTNKADHARFMREVRRAFKQGIILIVLCESGGNRKGAVNSVRDVYGWESEYTHVPGWRLAEIMQHLRVSYGVRFCFCDKRSTGKKILEILQTYENGRIER